MKIARIMPSFDKGIRPLDQQNKYLVSWMPIFIILL